MSVSKEDVRYLANLARLEFTDKEEEKFTNDLSNIVDFANTLSKVVVENVRPTAHILDLQNVLREDIVCKSYSREEILKNAPSKQAGCISVPKVME